jgi:ATP dependent DNA ligase domain
MKTLATATLTHVRWQMPYHSHPQTQNIMGQPLTERRRLLETQILPPLKEPVQSSISLDATLPDLIRSVKAHGLDGLVAKRRDRQYMPGKRSGAWQKMRVNRAQDFCNRRIYHRRQHIRCADIRLLRRQEPVLRGPDSQWLYLGIARGIDAPFSSA